jgi:hypothetical protein
VLARIAALGDTHAFKAMHNIEAGFAACEQLDIGGGTLISTDSLGHLCSKMPVNAGISCFNRKEKTTSHEEAPV